MSEKEIQKYFQEYFQEIRSIYLSKDYTEWSYRTPFQNLIKRLNSNYNIIEEPKRSAELGAPDFKAFYNNRKVGFIETKDIEDNLEKALGSDQLKKYISAIDNLILTNYIQFILIRNGRKVYDCNLFTLSDLNKGSSIISLFWRVL